MDYWKRKAKGALKSLTVWFNTAAAVVVVMLPQIEAQMQTSLTPEQYQDFALGMLAINIALRIKTAKDLADK